MVPRRGLGFSHTLAAPQCVGHMETHPKHRGQDQAEVEGELPVLGGAELPLTGWERQQP